jgi:hypothetical protein
MPSVSSLRPGADNGFKARLLADLVGTATGEVLLILAG